MGSLSPSRLLHRALAAACSRRPAAPAPVRQVAPSVADYYDAGGEVPEPLLKETSSDRGCRRDRILLPARLPDALADVPRAEDPIEILHYRPLEDGPTARPLVLLSPILGNTWLVASHVARTFARQGLHAAIVHRKQLVFDPQQSVRRAEDEVRLVVMRSRQAVDWLARDPHVDPQRLGTFGASAGAIVSSMLAGADPRLCAHVWWLAGGPLAHVMAHTVEREYRDYRRAALRASGRRLGTLRDDLGGMLRTCPLGLARHVEPRQVLLVLARFDRSVPYRFGLRLWQELGRPERILVPLGHYGTFLLLPWLAQVSLEHFRRQFGP